MNFKYICTVLAYKVKNMVSLTVLFGIDNHECGTIILQNCPRGIQGKLGDY